MKAILTIGIQGTGKSTYSKKLESADPTKKRVTKDEIRFMLFDLNNYTADTYEDLHRRFGGRLEIIYWMMIDVVLQQGLTVILDETHHTKKERKATLARLRVTYPSIKVEAHYLYSDFQRCLARNAKRRPEQIVPEQVMRRFQQELVASFGGSAIPYKAGAKLGWENFDVVRCIKAEDFLDN